MSIKSTIRMISLPLAALVLMGPVPDALAETTAPAAASETSTTSVSTPTTSTQTATTQASAPSEQPNAATPTQTSSTPSVTPQVKTQLPQAQSTTQARSHHAGKAKGKAGEGSPTNEKEGAGEKAFSHHKKAPAPSVLTPPLPSTLGSTVSGVPDFFLGSFSIPPFLLPIYQAAGTAYGIPWQVLAAINEVETDYGRDLSVSSAGAEGWMQFLPTEWEQYGVDATAQGLEDPYNPVDAIFAAARYLKAAGGDKNLREAIFSYNHSQAYVDSVMMRAQLLGGTPTGLLSAITGLTEARFPVHAPSHFTDGFPSLPSGSSGTLESVAGTTIYSEADAPVIAAQDGVITKIGHSPALGHYISLRDVFGNTYTYAQLGNVARLYPVLELRGHSAPALASEAKSNSTSEPRPSGPASAGSQPRSPLSEGAVGYSLALEASAGIGSPSAAPPASIAKVSAPSNSAVRQFRAGPDEVYLHPLRVGVQVIAGTVLGHLGSVDASQPEPHMLFQIRPSGVGSPMIDPKPILDGWVLLEDTSVFKAKGADPFAETKPTPGQVLLESKNQLEQQVLRNPSIRIYSCGRGDIQTGKVDRRVLAVLEFLSVSGLQPTVSALKCAHTAPSVPGSAEYRSGETVDISRVNGVKIAGHIGPGSITETTIAKLLDLQGTVRPLQITSPTRHSGASNTLLVHGPYTHIHVSFDSLYSSNARLAKAVNSELSPSQWIKLIARLGEIPNPTVSSKPSAAAIPDRPEPTTSPQAGQSGG